MYISDSAETTPANIIGNSQTESAIQSTPTYDNVLHSTGANKADEIKPWLETLQRPSDITNEAYKTFMRYCTEFFIAHNKLWRKNTKGHHKLVIPKDRYLFLIKSAHNNVGHHGFYATHALLSEQYWWPHMAQDINWFIVTCHVCQTRKTQQVLIAPIVAMPAPLFSKVYIDTMHMPPSLGYKYIVQGRCSLIYWPEWAMLIKENAAALGKWILHDIIY